MHEKGKDVTRNGNGEAQIEDLFRTFGSGTRTTIVSYSHSL